MKLKYVVFVCGAVVMALEILGSRVIAPFYGNSLYAWGSLIGVILGALSLGYYLGGRAADRDPSFHGLSMIMLKAGFLIALIPFLSPVVLDPSLVYLMGMRYGALVSVLFLFTAPSVYLGMVSPYAVKLEAKNLEAIGNTAGNLYAISTMGSIAGTFLTSFFLIPEIGVQAIIYLLSAILILSALISSGKKILAPILLWSAAFVVASLSLSTYSTAAPDYSILFQKDSAYYQVKVVEDVNKSERLLFLDGSYTGGMFTNSTDAVFQYTDYFHLPYVLDRGISDVLFMGGGAGTGPKRFRGAYPEDNIDVVDIDPEVNKEALEYFDLLADEKMKIYAEEGRTFLANTPKKYDLIVLDAFSSRNTVPYHFMTKEFIGTVKDRLTVNGSVIINFHSAITGPKSGLFNAEYRTYKAVFPTVYVFPVESDPEELQNVIMIASKSGKRLTRQEFIEGAGNLSKQTGITHLGEYAGHLLETEPAEGILLTDDYCPVDNLLLPAIN